MLELAVELIIVLTSVSAVAFEWLTEQVARGNFRETETGSVLEDNLMLRLLYDLVFVVWWATSIGPIIDSIGVLVAMSLLGGGATVGWDMFVHWFVYRVKSAKESAVEKAEAAHGEMEDNDSSMGSESESGDSSDRED